MSNTSNVGKVINLSENQQRAKDGVSSFNGRTGAVAPENGDYTAEQVGAVPIGRTVNNKDLSSDIVLSASDVPCDGAASGLEAKTVQAAIDELQETKLAAIDGQPGEFMGFGPDGEPTALPASRGIPPGGGLWDVLKKKSNTDYDAGWTSITDIVVMNNAYGRNGVYRDGIISWNTPPSDEFYAEIAAGTFKNMFIGDQLAVTWGNSGFLDNFYIAAFDYFRGPFNSDLPHHIVVVPRYSLGEDKMNSTATTQGGYVGSSVHTTALEPIRAKIREVFGSGHVMKHDLHLCNAVSNGHPCGGLWVNTDVELMTEQMVYGSGVYRASSNRWDHSFVEKSQLPIFALNQSILDDYMSYSSFWLRDVVSDSEFACVNGATNMSIQNAEGTWTPVRAASFPSKRDASDSLKIIP